MSIEVKNSDFPTSKFDVEPFLSHSICILPNNYESASEPTDYCYSSTLLSFMKLAEKDGLAIKVIGQEDNFNLLEQRSIEYFGPLLLIGAHYVSQNPKVISVLVSILANYFTKLSAGRKDGTANWTVLITDEKSKKFTKITYKGPVKGLSEVGKTIQQVSSDLRNGK